MAEEQGRHRRRQETFGMFVQLVGLLIGRGSLSVDSDTAAGFLRAKDRACSAIAAIIVALGTPRASSCSGTGGNRKVPRRRDSD
jgi:hypothetical protein